MPNAVLFVSTIFEATVWARPASLKVTGLNDTVQSLQLARNYFNQVCEVVAGLPRGGAGFLGAQQLFVRSVDLCHRT